MNWVPQIFDATPTLTAGAAIAYWRCNDAVEPIQIDRLYKSVGDLRSFGYDLGNIRELITGKTISSATIAPSVGGSGLTIGAVSIGTYRVSALFSGGNVGEHEITVNVTLSDGTTIRRAGLLVVS